MQYYLIRWMSTDSKHVFKVNPSSKQNVHFKLAPGLSDLAAIWFIHMNYRKSTKIHPCSRQISEYIVLMIIILCLSSYFTCFYSSLPMILYLGTIQPNCSCRYGRQAIQTSFPFRREMVGILIPGYRMELPKL